MRVRVYGLSNNEGVVVDFIELKSALSSIISPFFGKLINNIIPFDTVSPSAEHIAKYLYDSLKERYDAPLRVEVGEAPGCVAAFGDV